jgi:cytochrome c55X
MGRLLFALLITANAYASEPSQERQQVLRNMLKHDCGACHGLTRQGGLGPSLLPEALADKSDALLVRTIQEGRQGTAMPPWKMFITENESLWLIEEFFRQ